MGSFCLIKLNASLKLILKATYEKNIPTSQHLPKCYNSLNYLGLQTQNYCLIRRTNKSTSSDSVEACGN